MIKTRQVDVLFIVNDSQDGNCGRRIRNFIKSFSRIKDYEVVYRDDKRKIKSLFRFTRAIIMNKPKIVYVELMAYSGCFAALLGKLFVRFKYVLCVSDAYAELTKSNHNKLTVFFAGVAEKIWLKSADFILTWNPMHAQWLKARIRTNSVDYLEYGIDTDRFKPSDQKELRQRLMLGDSLVVGLIGSLRWSKRYHFCYGWDLVEAAKYLKDLDIKLLIVGDGSGMPYLKKVAASYGFNERVIFTGRIPNDKIPDYINCMDICVSTQSNDLVGLLRCPTKLSEYMACGKYIISSDVGYAKLYVDKVGKLLLYTGVKDNTYPKRLSDHLRCLYFNRELLENGNKGVSLVKEFLENSKLANKLEGILVKFLDSKS